MTNEHTIKEIKNKIHAENEARRLIKLKLQQIKRVFEKYLNKEVLKNDYTLFKKIDDEVKPLLNRDELVKPLREGDNARISVIYLKCSEYSIYLHLSLCFSGGSYDDKSYYCFYHEVSPYIVEIKNKKVIKLYETEEYKEIDQDEQIKIFLEAEAKAEELRQIKDKLFYFVRSKVSNG